MDEGRKGGEVSLNGGIRQIFHQRLSDAIAFAGVAVLDCRVLSLSTEWGRKRKNYIRVSFRGGGLDKQ